MKQQQSIVKRGVCRSVFLAMSAVLACAIAVLLAGGISTNTSAKAADVAMSEGAQVSMRQYAKDKDIFLLSQTPVKATNNSNDMVLDTALGRGYTFNGLLYVNFYIFIDRHVFDDVIPLSVADSVIVSASWVSNKEQKQWSSDDGYCTLTTYGDVFVLRTGHLNSLSMWEGLDGLQSVAFDLHILDREPVPLPDDPSKEGHTFAGWYYGNGENCSEDCAPYIGDTITENTDLHAHWTINMYTVTYNTANGSVVAPATVAWNTAAPMPEPKRTGYNFLGWFREDGTQYNGEVITEDTTLTARWDVQMLTVTFYLDNEIYATVNVEYGTTLAKVMKYAKVIDYLPLDSNGVRVSLRSAITADTTVLLHELSGWEKYGNFVGRSPWYTWLMVGLGSALTLAFAVTLALLIRARR